MSTATNALRVGLLKRGWLQRTIQVSGPGNPTLTYDARAMGVALLFDDVLIDGQSARYHRRTVDRLRSRLGPSAFEVLDHWEGDRIAIGIASPRDHHVLVYLAAYEDGFLVELEMPPIPGADFPYEVAGRQSGLGFDHLVHVAAEHLARA